MSVDSLDGLLAEAMLQPPAAQSPPAQTVPTVPAKWPSGAAMGIGKVKYTHDAMINLIIANPAISQNALALHFGYSAGWVSQIIASDAFQSRLAERTEELVDPTIRASVEEQFKGMVLRSMAILREKLSQPAALVPDQLAIRTLELSSRALGYGARPEPPPPVQVNMEVHLEQLGDNLTKLLSRRKAELIEGDVISEQ